MRDYPTFPPENEVFTEKLVLNACTLTNHMGVALTMAKIREQYWVPRMKKLKKSRSSSAVTIANPQTGNLPRVRMEGATPLQDI